MVSIGNRKRLILAIVAGCAVAFALVCFLTTESLSIGNSLGAGSDTPGSFCFAEGTTRPNFETYFCIQNLDIIDAPVKITYMRGRGTVTEQNITVSAHSRATVSVRDVIGSSADEDCDFSAIVESTDRVNIYPERVMYFKYKEEWTGGSTAVGVPEPGGIFPQDIVNGYPYNYFFAEGSTRSNFDTYICIQNLDPIDAEVCITYMLGDGTSRVQELTVPKKSRKTVPVKDFLGSGDDTAHDFSAMVESHTRIFVERSMYFNYNGKWEGGHIGEPEVWPRNTYYFADCTTGPSYDTFFCIMNPGSDDAWVTVTYSWKAGTGIEQGIVVPARSRRTVASEDMLGSLNDECNSFAVKVKTDVETPVVVERSSYFKYGDAITGGYVLMGAGINDTFYFPEGTTRPGFETYIIIYNFSAPADVRIIYVLGDGRTKVQEVTVPSDSGQKVAVKDFLGSGDAASHDFSAIVESPNFGIVAERSVYFSYGGWTGGHTSNGYYFPRGSPYR